MRVVEIPDRVGDLIGGGVETGVSVGFAQAVECVCGGAIGLGVEFEGIEASQAGEGTDFGEFCDIESGIGEIGAVQSGVFEAYLIKKCSGEVGASEVGVHKISEDESGSIEFGILQVCV